MKIYAEFYKNWKFARCWFKDGDLIEISFYCHPYNPSDDWRSDDCADFSFAVRKEDMEHGAS